jgi:hypothetical protein
MRQGTTVHTRRRAALVLAPALTATVMLGVTACGGSEQTVSSSDPPRDQTRFEKRATQIEQDWPKVDKTKGRQLDMLPLEAAKRSKSGGTSLTLTVGHAGCETKYGAHVRETDKLVIVSGWAKKDKHADFCTKQIVTNDKTVKLKSELGSRTVIDAATGEKLLKG